MSHTGWAFNTTLMSTMCGRVITKRVRLIKRAVLTQRECGWIEHREIIITKRVDTKRVDTAWVGWTQSVDTKRLLSQRDTAEVWTKKAKFRHEPELFLECCLCAKAINTWSYLPSPLSPLTCLWLVCFKQNLWSSKSCCSPVWLHSRVWSFKIRDPVLRPMLRSSSG